MGNPSPTSPWFSVFEVLRRYRNTSLSPLPLGLPHCLPYRLHHMRPRTPALLVLIVHSFLRQLSQPRGTRNGPGEILSKKPVSPSVKLSYLCGIELLTTRSKVQRRLVHSKSTQ
jgi:hypothetical protein